MSVRWLAFLGGGDCIGGAREASDSLGPSATCHEGRIAGHGPRSRPSRDANVEKCRYMLIISIDVG